MATTEGNASWRKRKSGKIVGGEGSCSVVSGGDPDLLLDMTN